MGRLYRALQNGPRWAGIPGAYFAEDLTQKPIGYLIVVNQASRSVDRIFLFDGEPFEDVRKVFSGYPMPAFDILSGSARNTSDLAMASSGYVWDERKIQPEELTPSS